MMDVALQSGDLAAVSALVAEGNDISAHDLIWACYGGHTHIVEYARSLGTRVSTELLDIACWGGHRLLAERLLAWGVWPGPETLANACSGNDVRLVAQIYEISGYSPIALETAAARGNIDVVRFFFARGHNFRAEFLEETDISVLIDIRDRLSSSETELSEDSLY